MLQRLLTVVFQSPVNPQFKFQTTNLGVTEHLAGFGPYARLSGC